jgi:hypothetical protein
MPDTRYMSLKRSAIESAESRGHSLSRFTFCLMPNRLTGSASCKRCNATVTINTNPLPNDTDIAGKAVAVNCIADALAL